MIERSHAQHRKGQQWNAESDAPPKTMGHVAEFGILFVRRGDRHRLERHATDRTGPRAVANDLGMHRTSPLRPRGSQWHLGFQSHSALRTRSGAGLANLWVHGADVGRARNRRGLRGSHGGQLRSNRYLRKILLRVSFEFVGTASGTEIVG